MPWLRNKVISFSNGVLGIDYTKMSEQNGPKEIIISPEPTGFCLDFINGALDVINNNQTYHFCLDTVSYFVSALPHADNPLFRKLINLQLFMDEINKIVADPATYPDVIQKFSQEIKEKEEQIWANWSVNQVLDNNG